MAQIINGNEIAQKILTELSKLPTPKKEMAAILVGNDSASLSFLRQKGKTATSLGINFKLYQLPDSLTQSELENKIKEISSDENVGGIIVQLPLPTKFNRTPILTAIATNKDIDALSGKQTEILAPAAAALKRILQEINFSLAKKEVAVIGIGKLIGQPIINWLNKKVGVITSVSKGGYNPKKINQADLIITGTGVPNLIKGQDIKPGAVVVDYGYGKINGELAGDAEFNSVKDIASFITPTPGGTGPIVVAQLIANFYILNQNID